MQRTNDVVERYCDEAAKLLLNASQIGGIISKLVLLKEALRLYLLVALTLTGEEADPDSGLLDLYADVFKLAQNKELGFQKLEGFAALDVTMREVNELTDTDIEWFSECVGRTGKRVVELVAQM